MRGGAGGRAAGGAAAHAAAVAAAPRPLLVLAALALAAAAAAAAAAAPPAYAQAAAGGEGEGPSESDLVIIFAASIAAVAGIALYVSREAIARKRTDYDRGAYDSQRDRDYEKYHSGWGDESAAGRGAEIGDGGDGDGDGDGDGGEDEFRPGRPAAGARGPDYYEVLGLERTAAAGEVKRRYRELAKRVHPDRAGEEDGDGAGRRMALINEAYGVLSDPGRRKRYDLWLGRGGGSRRG